MTKTTVTLAQISDVHLPFPNWPPFRYWNAKRTLGLLNWYRGRRFVHRIEAVDRLVADMKAHTPDHVAVTGDLVNLGLPQEYRAAKGWLETLGSPDTVSVIPGNHDIYCPLDNQEHCYQVWAEYMQSDAFGRELGLLEPGSFPFVRRIGPVALICANSALPTPPFFAHGHIGAVQFESIEKSLQEVANSGLFACLMLHHPPLPGQAPRRRALIDAIKMRQLIATNPVGVVLYGHNHTDDVTWVANTHEPDKKTAICGAASGSAWRRHKKEPKARYYLYIFNRASDVVTVERVTRGLSDTHDTVVELNRVKLFPS